MFQVGIVETKQKQNFIEQYNYKQGNSTMVLKTTWCIQFIWFNFDFDLMFEQLNETSLF